MSDFYPLRTSPEEDCSAEMAAALRPVCWAISETAGFHVDPPFYISGPPERIQFAFLHNGKMRGVRMHNPLTKPQAIRRAVCRVYEIRNS